MADDFDVAKADRSFAARFFNDTWTYLDKVDRTPEETEAMLHCCHASFHHWTRVADKKPSNVAVGYWQLSRVSAVAGRAEDAERYAQSCFAIAAIVTDEPWLAGSAHEALARAASLRGDRAARDVHVKAARAVLARLTDPEEIKILQADIDSVP
jgi:hypothetical protein